MEAIVVVLWIIGGLLGFFTLHTVLLVLFSAVYYIVHKNRKPVDGRCENRFAIIVPAHNEELLIGDVVKSLMDIDYPEEKYDVHVIADNCSDSTADIARRNGAQCHERFDDVRRGKPYALDWLISRLDLNNYDAYVIIDADTTVDGQFLRVMESYLANGAQAVQGYFGVQNPDENWLTRLSLLPGILKFKMHFPGKKLLNWSCPLAGNGMCFKAEIFKKFGWNAYSIAENWEYYVILLLNGYVPTSAEEAVIYSQVAKSLSAGKSQRTRWLRGRLDTLHRYWKPLLLGALRGGGLKYLDALVELVRPSHSMLFFWSLVHLAVVSALALSTTMPVSLVWVSAVVFVSQVAYYLTGLIIQKAPLSTWLSLIMVPPYLVWKLSISVLGLVGMGDKRWVKTERHRKE